MVTAGVIKRSRWELSFQEWRWIFAGIIYTSSFPASHVAMFGG